MIKNTTVMLGKQVADSTQMESVPQTAATMLPRIVAHVAGLTERRQVSRAVVTGVVIEVRAGQDHVGSAWPFVNRYAAYPKRKDD